MNDESVPQSLLTRSYLRLASGRVVAVFAVLYVVNQAALLFMFSRLGRDPLDLQLTLSKDVFLSIVSRWGDRGVATYLTHFCLDFFHPILYGVFLASAIARLSIKRRTQPSAGIRVLFLLPFAAGFCDIVENIMHVAMLTGFIEISRFAVAFSGAFTWVKWTLAAVSILSIIVLGIRKIASSKEKTANGV